MLRSRLPAVSLLLALAGLASPAPAGLTDLDNPEPTMTSFSAVRRNPPVVKWDVDVSFTGPADGHRYRIELIAFDEAGGTNLAVRTAWHEATPAVVSNPVDVPSPGTHRLVWDAEADLPEGVDADRVTVSAKLLDPVWTFDIIPEIDPDDEWAPATVYHDVQTVAAYGEIEKHAPTVRCLTDEWNLESELGANVVFSGASMGLHRSGSWVFANRNPITLWTISDTTNTYRMVDLDYEKGTVIPNSDTPFAFQLGSGPDIRFFQTRNESRRYGVVCRANGHDVFMKSTGHGDETFRALGNRYGDDEHGFAVCGYFPNGVPLSDSTQTSISTDDTGTHGAVFFCGESGVDRKEAVLEAGPSAVMRRSSMYSCMKNPTGRYVVPLLDANTYFTVGHGNGDTNAVQTHRVFMGDFSQRSGEIFDLHPTGRGTDWIRREPEVAYSKAVAMPDGVRFFFGGAGRDSDSTIKMWCGSSDQYAGDGLQDDPDSVAPIMRKRVYAKYPAGHPFESWARRDVTCLLPNGKFCGVDEELGLVVVNPLTGETYVASDDPAFKKGKMGCQLLPNGKVWIIPYDCEGREYQAGTNLCGKLYEVDFGFTRSFSLSSLCSPYLKVAEGDPEPSGVKVGLDPNGGELPGVYAQYYKGENPVYGELPEPTRPNHTFFGWSTNGTEEAVVSGADSVPASGIRLQAVWKQIWYVDATTGDDENAGTGPDIPFKTIQKAVETCADGDTILVGPGIYKETASSTGGVYNTNGCVATLRSTDGPFATIIDGDRQRRVVKGTATETQNDWTNHALTLEGFTLRNGKRDGTAGVAYANLVNCIISNNVSARTACAAAACHLENCLIVGNVASNVYAEGIGLVLDQAEAFNCTIVANTGNPAGKTGGIGRSSLVNCIIYGNDFGDVLRSGGGGVAEYTAADSALEGEGNVLLSEDPFFDAAKGDYRVRAIAPCVDTGDSARAAGTTDLAGNPRIAHAAVDMGCYEYGVPATPVIEPPDGTKFANKASQSVMLTCTDPDARIYHTVDGSEPATNSATSVKFSIRETTTVKAIAVVRGDWASEVATATIVRVYVAQAPDGLAAEQEGAAIALAWDGVGTADSYRVYRGASPDLAAATLLGTTEGTSWTDSTVEAGRTYYYFVVSENIAGVSEAGAPALGSTLSLATAVNMPQLAFATGADCPWAAELSADAADAAHDARSGAPGDNGESWIETTVEGPGQIDFQWRASCERDDSGERDWDHLVFEIDGVEKARLDGRTKWERASFAVEGEGTHALRWTYAKDAGMAEGEDRGWLDCVQWIPEATKGEWEAWVDFHGIGSPSGYEALKPLPSGKGDTLYEEFVAGLNPLDALSSLLADILVPGDEPEISWHPDLGARRVYTVEGKPFLTNEVWTAPNADSRFFRVWVSLPE